LDRRDLGAVDGQILAVGQIANDDISSDMLSCIYVDFQFICNL